MQKFILFKNSKIAYTDFGKGTTVVLLHGFLANKSMWNGIAEEISKRNRVIAIDLLGHGKTACLGYVHTMELMAEIVENVLKTLKIRRVFCIGHSLGGYVALAFAEKNLKKIKGLCLLNSSAREDSLERKLIRTRANKMAQTNFKNIVKISFANLFCEVSKTLFKDEMKQALQVALKISVQSYIATQEGMKLRLNRCGFLKNSNFKKLMIIGKKDPVLDYKKLLEEAKTTDSEIVVLNGGHMSHIENRNKLIAVLKKFLC